MEEALVASEFYPIDRVKWFFGRTYYALPNAAYNTYKASEHLDPMAEQSSLPPDTTTYFMIAVSRF